MKLNEHYVTRFAAWWSLIVMVLVAAVITLYQIYRCTPFQHCFGEPSILNSPILAKLTMVMPTV